MLLVLEVAASIARRSLIGNRSFHETRMERESLQREFGVVKERSDASNYRLNKYPTVIDIKFATAIAWTFWSISGTRP